MQATTAIANGLKHLKELYLSKKGFAPKITDRTANGLTRCIIDFLNLSGWQAERINCTGRIIDTRKTYTDVCGFTRTIGNVKYGKTSGQRGTADISATIKGRSVKIEVKIGADKQSQTQKEYEQSIIKAGGFYFIARNFQNFYEWYNRKMNNYARYGV